MLIHYLFSNEIQAVSVGGEYEVVQPHRLQRYKSNRKDKAVCEDGRRVATSSLVHKMLNG